MTAVSRNEGECKETGYLDGPHEPKLILAVSVMSHWCLGNKMSLWHQMRHIYKNGNSHLFFGPGCPAKIAGQLDQ